jgi:pyruvate dehydrogenase complex dehydrogenase (E1) component
MPLGHTAPVMYAKTCAGGLVVELHMRARRYVVADARGQSFPSYPVWRGPRFLIR